MVTSYIAMFTCYVLCLLLLTDITIRFDQPEYTALTSPVLILSHILPCPVTIYVSNRNITENELSTLEGL